MLPNSRFYKFLLLDEKNADGAGEAGDEGKEGKDDKNKDGKDGDGDKSGAAKSKALASELKKERDARTKLENEIKEIKESKLKESNDYKALYEQEKTSKAELETRFSKLKENVTYNEKYKAVATELRKKGLKAEAESILEKESLDDVVVETTSEGRFLVHGADTFADTFKKRYGFAFETKKAPTTNGGGGNNSGGNNEGGDDVITGGDLYKIEKEKGVKSPEYIAAFSKYKAQKIKKSS